MDNILEINKTYKESKKSLDEKHADIAKLVLSEIEEYVNGRIGYYEKAIEYCAKQGSSMYIIWNRDAEINYKATEIHNKFKDTSVGKIENVIIAVLYRRLYKKYGRYYSVELKEDNIVIKWDKVKTDKWWIRNYFTEDWSDVSLYSVFALILTVFCGFVIGMFIKAVFGTINANIFFGVILFIGLIIALSIIIKHIYQKAMFTKKVKNGEFFQSVVDEKCKQINKNILESDYLFKKPS